jgi:hypothetical protein
VVRKVKVFVGSGLFAVGEFCILDFYFRTFVFMLQELYCEDGGSMSPTKPW